MREWIAVVIGILVVVGWLWSSPRAVDAVARYPRAAEGRFR